MSASVFCRRCGVLNAVDRRRCRECRADLVSGEPAPPRPAFVPDVVPASGMAGARLAAAPLPAPAVDYAPVEGLACPACGVPLEEGEAFIEDARAGMWTGPHLALVFRFRGVDQRKRMMRDDGLRAAARCRHCGGVWIAPRPDRTRRS